MKLLKKIDKFIVHQRLHKLIEPVFEIDGTKFYQFKDLTDMPADRYFKAVRAAHEFNLRITTDELTAITEAGLEYANKGNFTKVINILYLLKERAQMPISTDLGYRLFSIVYFTKDEDLTDYDETIGAAKIELFKKKDLAEVFGMESASNFIPNLNLSERDLQGFSELESLIKSRLNDLKTTGDLSELPLPTNTGATESPQT